MDELAAQQPAQQVGALGGTLRAGPEQGVFTLTACLPIRVGSP